VLPFEEVRETRFTLCAMVLALVCGAQAQERGRLLGVRAGGDAGASAIELLGDRPLSFTTMKLQGPPRVVVDFADTEIAGAPDELVVEDGTVRRVATAAAGARTARVVIELAAEAEFDIRSHGNRIEIRVPRLLPLQASGFRPQASDLRPQTPDNENENANPPAATAAANPNPIPNPNENPNENENQNQNQNANANPSPTPKPTIPEPQSEAQKRASLPTVALVASRPVAPAPAPPPTSAADKLRRDREQRMLAYAAAQREAAAKAAQASAERKAAQVAAQSAAQEKARAAAERAVADRIAADAAAAERRAARLAAQRAAAEKLAEESRAAAEAKRAGRAAPRQRTVAMAEPSRRSITGIGFRPRARGQVIVHSNQPLEYGVSGGDNNALLLHLPSAGIPLANNRRALDTRFFGGPVQRVVPLAVPGGTDVRIELSEHADYQLEQSGLILTVTFSARP
jgi:hypothetical protein